MDIGMWWFDNNPKSDLSTKIERAAKYYQEKYGQWPDLCYVHPEMLTEKMSPLDGLEIRSSKTMLNNHFWMGVSEPQNGESVL
jgi:hypothetical protein